jgi:hypothetical protein
VHCRPVASGLSSLHPSPSVVFSNYNRPYQRTGDGFVGVLVSSVDLGTGDGFVGV